MLNQHSIITALIQKEILKDHANDIFFQKTFPICHPSIRFFVCLKEKTFCEWSAHNVNTLDGQK